MPVGDVSSHTPGTGKSRKSLLTQSFICKYGNGIRKIEASRLAYHGYSYAAVTVFLTQPFGKPRCLLAEHQRNVAGKVGFGIASRRFGRRKPQIIITVSGKIIIYVLIHRYVHKIPVVKAAAFDILIGYIETERLYEVESCPGRGTGARNGPGIVRYLRLYQNYIDQSALPFAVNMLTLHLVINNISTNSTKIMHFFYFFTDSCIIDKYGL